MRIALAPIIVVICLATLVLAFRFRGRWFIPRRRRAKKRHLVTRLVCGLLGAGIVAAVGVGTWQTVRAAYAPPRGAGVAVRAPTLPPPPVPVPPRRGREQDIPDARVLVTFLIADRAGGMCRPVHSEQFDVRLPADKGHKYGAAFRFPHLRGYYRFTIDRVFAARSDGDGGEVFYDGSDEFHVRSFDSSSHGSGFYRHRGTVGHLGALYVGEAAKALSDPLSVVPPVRRQYDAFVVRTLLAAGDPLKDVPLAEFVAGRRESLKAAAADDDTWRPYSRRRRQPAVSDLPAGVGGIRLAAHVGVAGLLLVVATLLLAQLSTRRAAVWVVLIIAATAYTVALDRAALAEHLSVLSNAATPLADRLTACDQAGRTFFYRQTALTALARQAGDAGAPAALRDAARHGAEELKHQQRRAHPDAAP